MICASCVEIEPLKKMVASKGVKSTCEYCNKRKICLDKIKVFDYVLARVRENTAVDDDLSNYEQTMFYECGSDEIDSAYFDVVAAEWLGIQNSDVTNDFYEYAPSSFKDDEKGHGIVYFKDYGNLERNIVEDEWQNFIADINHSHRFFNPCAKEFLDKVFGLTARDDGQLKSELITVVKHGEILYRARTVSNYEAAKLLKDDPAGQFGPPPKGVAGSQRMTPSGISAMYCGFERETCLSEIRAITGDFVVSAGFTPVGPMKFLNLSSLNDVVGPTLTIMDEGYLQSVHLTAFIKSIVNKMSKPKGRNDELSYLSLKSSLSIYG